MSKEKTNVMRLLEQAGVAFSVHPYPVDESDLSGVHVAALLGLEAESIFKTLVTVGDGGGHFVFLLPSNLELHLKRAAKASGNKQLQMLPMAGLKAITGYIRGGCSPIGMKKHFPTYIDDTAQLFERVYISAGQRGIMLGIAPKDLLQCANATYAEIRK